MAKTHPGSRGLEFQFQHGGFKPPSPRRLPESTGYWIFQVRALSTSPSEVAPLCNEGTQDLWGTEAQQLLGNDFCSLLRQEDLDSSPASLDEIQKQSHGCLI